MSCVILAQKKNRAQPYDAIKDHGCFWNHPSSPYCLYGYYLDRPLYGDHTNQMRKNGEKVERKMQQNVAQWISEILQTVNYLYGYVLFICRCHPTFPSAVLGWKIGSHLSHVISKHYLYWPNLRPPHLFALTFHTPTFPPPSICSFQFSMFPFMFSYANQKCE